jgi:hypothetical protein
MLATYKGHTIGAHGSPVQIASATGLEDFASDAPALPADGRDGAHPAPMRSRPRSWILDCTVFADTPDQLAAELDTLHAAWLPAADRLEQTPFDFTLTGQAERTLFARCTAIQVGTSFETADRYRAAHVQIGFEALDPQAYGPEITIGPLDPGDSFEVVGTLPHLEPRWKLVVDGPVTLPQIASSIGPWAVVRWGSTNDGAIPLVSGRSLVLDVSPKGLIARRLPSVDVDDYRSRDVGENAYPQLDGGAAARKRPPQWFPLVPGTQTITYSAYSGSGTATFTYRLPVR